MFIRNVKYSGSIRGFSAPTKEKAHGIACIYRMFQKSVLYQMANFAHFLGPARRGQRPQQQKPPPVAEAVLEEKKVNRKKQTRKGKFSRINLTFLLN